MSIYVFVSFFCIWHGQTAVLCILGRNHLFKNIPSLVMMNSEGREQSIRCRQVGKRRSTHIRDSPSSGKLLDVGQGAFAREMLLKESCFPLIFPSSITLLMPTAELQAASPLESTPVPSQVKWRVGGVSFSP